MKGVLKQADARRRSAARDHRLHELAPHAGVLEPWIDGDRPDAADRVALVEEVGADDLTVLPKFQ